MKAFSSPHNSNWFCLCPASELFIQLQYTNKINLNYEEKKMLSCTNSYHLHYFYYSFFFTVSSAIYSMADISPFFPSHYLTFFSMLYDCFSFYSFIIACLLPLSCVFPSFLPLSLFFLTLVFYAYRTVFSG